MKYKHCKILNLENFVENSIQKLTAEVNNDKMRSFTIEVDSIKDTLYLMFTKTTLKICIFCKLSF